MGGLNIADTRSDSVPLITITGLRQTRQQDDTQEHGPTSITMPIPDDWMNKDLKEVAEALESMVS